MVFVATPNEVECLVVGDDQSEVRNRAVGFIRVQIGLVLKHWLQFTSVSSLTFKSYILEWLEFAEQDC